MPARSILGLPVSPLVFIFLTIFIDMIGSSILFPVLPFLVERYRSDALTLGLLASTFSIAQFLATPVLGALSDRYGRRPVLLLCVLGTAVGYFMFGLANSLWVLFLSRIIDGVTGGVIATAQAYIADTSTAEERTKNFGLIGAAFGLGFILGPALGGALASIDLNLPVFFAGTLALLNAVLGYFTLDESLSPDLRRPFGLSDLNPFKQLSALARDTRVRGLVLGFFIFNFAFAGFTSVFAIFLRDRFGWGPALSAGIFAFIGLVSAAVQGGLIRKLLPAFGEARLAVSGLLCVSAAFGLAALVPAGAGILLYPTQGLLALGVGLTIPSLRGLISNRVLANEQGRVIGGSQSLASLAQVIGPLWAGWTFDYLGILTPLWSGALWVLVALACIVPNLRTTVSGTR